MAISWPISTQIGPRKWLDARGALDNLKPPGGFVWGAIFVHGTPHTWLLPTHPEVSAAMGGRLGWEGGGGGGAQPHPSIHGNERV